MRSILMVAITLLCSSLAPASLMSQNESSARGGWPITITITPKGPFEVLEEEVSGVNLIGLDERAITRLVLHDRIQRVSVIECPITDCLCALIARISPQSLALEFCRSTTRRNLFTLMGLASLHDLRLVDGSALVVDDGSDPLVIGPDVRVFRCAHVRGMLFDLVVSALVKCAPLEDLELSYVPGVADPVPLAMKGLRKLVLSGNYGVTDSYLSEQVCSVDTLEALDIDGCSRVTASGLRRIGELKQLKHLRIGALVIDSAAVAALSTLQGLTSVDIGLSRAPTAVLRQLFALPSLRSITAIGSCVDDQLLLEVGEDIAKLEYLSLALCDGITDVGARVIASNAVAMKELDLLGCPRISSECRSALKWLFADRRIWVDCG